ncbi:Sjogren's syndrome/scleroderma autoantigen 1 family protein, partial [Halorubrum pallidum]
MSDGFDKEAEREKLREKFARDDKKREHTQRMSELLLQGATMTNRHCDDCGDPIFRHDGREFCPTCHSGESNDAASAADQSASDPQTGANTNSTAGPRDGDDNGSGMPTIESTGADVPANPSGPDASTTDTSSGASTPDATTDASAPRSQPRGGEPTDRSETAGSRTGGSGTVADARQSLIETLVRFSRKAEATDDPRRAREFLQA